MGPTGCPETSVMNYHYLLRNNPEERSSDLLRCGSLKSRMNFSYFQNVSMIIRPFACSQYVINCVKQAWRFWLSEEPPVTVRATLERFVRLIAEYMITYNDASQSVGLLWTNDQSVAETSTWQHTTLTTHKLPSPGWDSNPRSQQASGRRPTP